MALDLFEREHEETAYGDFLDDVESSVRKVLGEGYLIDRRRVLRNNSVWWDCLTIREEDHRVAPTIYLNRFYEEYQSGRSIADITAEIVSIYVDNKEAVSVSDFEDMSFENVRDRIIMRLVARELNSEMLADMPMIESGDLAVTFHLLVTAGNGCNGTIRITNSIMESMGADIGMLMNAARRNTPRIMPYRLYTMTEMLVKMLSEKLGTLEKQAASDETIDRQIEETVRQLEAVKSESEKDLMYVVTSESGCCGATCLLYDGVLDEIYSRLGEPFYILPSSIHEAILVPSSAGDIEELKDMVSFVNRTEVDPQDILSYEVYTYPEGFPSAELARELQ